MQAIIILNPTAGRRAPRRVEHILNALRRLEYRFTLMETTHPGHATALARAARTNGLRCVIAAGGDGTIAEVVNGLMPSPHGNYPLHEAPSLGIVPLGTANVLAHELNLPAAPQALAACLQAGHTRPLWPGLATHLHTTRPDAPDISAHRFFVQMLGAGFDGQVVHSLAPALKHRWGRAAYVACALRCLRDHSFAPLDIRLDGVAHQATSAIITKGRFYGGRYRLAPTARNDQPGFTVIMLRHAHKATALMAMAALPLGLLARLPGAHLHTAGRIDILTPVALQTDGDPWGHAPVHIQDPTLPLNVIVPGP